MRSIFYRLYQDFKGEILILPSRIIAFFGFLLLLIAPLVIRDPYLLRIMVLTFIYATFAASWDLLSGFVGQLNLGHAIFFGVAAYTTALLNLRLGLTPWISIPIGAVAAVIMGLLVGVPCLRLKGQYLSLATLAFPIILLGIIYLFSDFTGGELGVSGLTSLVGSRLSWYYVTLIVTSIMVVIMWKITDSKIGIIFHAIREDEIAARASGINTINYKLLAFCLSGFFAGIAGGLYAHFMRLAGPGTLNVLMSFQAVIWAIFGGIATIYGPVIGVIILFPLMEYLRVVPEIRMLIFALIVIVVLRFMPEGLVPWFIDRVEKECPRCKEHNVAWRKNCRVCGTSMQEKITFGGLNPEGGGSRLTTD